MITVNDWLEAVRARVVDGNGDDKIGMNYDYVRSRRAACLIGWLVQEPSLPLMAELGVEGWDDANDAAVNFMGDFVMAEHRLSVEGKAIYNLIFQSTDDEAFQFLVERGWLTSSTIDPQTVIWDGGLQFGGALMDGAGGLLPGED